MFTRLRSQPLLTATLLGMLVAPLFAACASKPEPAPPPGTSVTSSLPPVTASPSPAAVASPAASAPLTGGAACSAFPAGSTPGQTSALRITSGGIDRTFRIHISARLAAADRAPVVLNFHGLGSNATEQEFYSGLVPVSDREGFLLVSPDGTGATRGFSSFRNLGTGVDDVQFTRDLLDRVARDFCIDAARVYSTGLSNGAFMSSYLGCVLSDRIAAIAPVAGVYRPQGCARAIPVLAFHGTDDRVVPYDGGTVLGLLPYDGAVKGASGWAAANGCTPSLGSKETKLTEHVRRTDFLACGAVASVSLVTVEGGGHTWPGAIDVPTLGPVTKEISAADMIWAFFKEQRLP